MPPQVYSHNQDSADKYLKKWLGILGSRNQCWIKKPCTRLLMGCHCMLWCKLENNTSYRLWTNCVCRSMMIFLPSKFTANRQLPMLDSPQLNYRKFIQSQHLGWRLFRWKQEMKFIFFRPKNWLLFPMSPFINPMLSGTLDVDASYQLLEKINRWPNIRSPIPRTTQRESRKQRERGKNTGIEEDQVLCSTSWLKTLQDAIIGTDQKKTTFWVRIHNLYVELIDKTTEKVK